jgi:hypothetical protein
MGRYWGLLSDKMSDLQGINKGGTDILSAYLLTKLSQNYLK